MKYYQLLRQRRIDLNLSIQDVSSQTQLAPVYIEAIEQHNLDVFSDDFSFVRYFVHSYCDAIGVNWLVVQKEVDEDIHAYARARDHAITQAQRKIVSSMQPASRNKSRKRRSPLQRSLSRLSSSLVGKKSKRRYGRLVALAAAVVLVLVGFNAFTNLLAQRQALEQERLQQQELADKEKETEELAKQYAAEKEKKAIQLECEDQDQNIWLMSNIENKKTEISFEITLPEDSNVVIYKDGEALCSEDAIYSDKFEKTITVDENCILELQISNWTENKITVAGKKVKFYDTYWYEGYPACVIFRVQFNGTEAPLLPSEIDPEAYGEDYYYGDEYYGDEYYGDEYYYDETYY